MVPISLILLEVAGSFLPASNSLPYAQRPERCSPEWVGCGHRAVLPQALLSPIHCLSGQLSALLIAPLQRSFHTKSRHQCTVTHVHTRERVRHVTLELCSSCSTCLYRSRIWLCETVPGFVKLYTPCHQRGH